MPGIEQIPWLYDAVQWIADRTGFREWRAWLVGGAHGRTLDLGTGTGWHLARYPAGVRVVGVEPDRRVLARARRRAPRVPLAVGRAEALPFRSAAFDTVVSGLVFCSVGDPPLGLREVRRVLRPGGQLRMLEHVRSTNRLWAKVQDAVQPVYTPIVGGCHPNRDTEGTVERAGFQIDPATRRADGVLRRFVARPTVGGHPPERA